MKLQLGKEKAGLWRRAHRWCETYKTLSVLLIFLECLLVPFLYQILIELVRTGSWTKLWTYVSEHYRQMLIGWVTLALLFLAVTVLTARPAVAVGVLGTILLCGGVANLYKLQYREEPVLPRDLSVLGDGLKIASEMKLHVTAEMVLFAVTVVLLTVLSSLLHLPYSRGKRVWLLRTGLCAVLLAAGTCYTLLFICNDSLIKKYKVGSIPGGMAYSYYRGSFVTSFLYYAGASFIQAPDGYDEETLSVLAGEVSAAASDNQSEPDVIIVMCESWYDLAASIPAEYSEDLLANYHRIAAEGISGYSLSEGYGGGTANIEYSVLTGNCIGFLPSGSTAYCEYMHSDYPSYVGYLKSIGYDTQALHPYKDTFYNRKQAYVDLGFDAFQSEKDFIGATYAGKYVNEKSTIEKLIAEYQNMTDENDGQVFLHTVTMQNHVTYYPYVFPDGYRVTASLTGLNASETALLETVATNMRDIDAALGELIDYFSTCDRDVVILFFGDHQTAVADENGHSVTTLADANRGQEGTEALTANYRVPYLMWSNFEKKDAQTEELTSTYMLLPILLNEYGVAAPDYFNWLYANRTVLRGYSRGYVINPDGTLTDTPTAEQQALLDKIQLLEYDSVFGEGWARTAMYNTVAQE